MNKEKSACSLAVILEAVRYAELERKELSSGESGTMIKSVWQLMNPSGFKSRCSSVSTMIKSEEDGSLIRFTAHSHDNEPLTESYDDILVYHSLRRDGKPSAHYIIDGFCPKKII